MQKLFTLKQIAEKHGVTIHRVQSALQKSGITPRHLSNHEIRDLQWEGIDKRALKGVFVEAHALESLAFKIELNNRKSQHEINEVLGQMTLGFE